MLYKVISVFVLALLLAGGQVRGQGGLMIQKVQVKLLKDTLAVQPNTFGFNSFTVTNTASHQQQLAIEVESSRGWQLLHNIPASVELTPGQSQTFSLRVTPSNGTSADQWHTLRIRIHSMNEGWRAELPFLARVQSMSRWQASLLVPELYVQEDSAALAFRIIFKNTGNRQQRLHYTFRSPVRLSLPARNNTLVLGAGKDSVVVVKLLIRPGEINRLHNLEIPIDISGEDGNTLLLSQKFVTTPSTLRLNRSKWLTIPMILEANIFNLTSSSQRMAWGAVQGSLDLNKGRSVQFMYRSDNLSQAFNPSQTFVINNTIRQLVYATPNLRLSLGTQLDFMNMQINGEGIGVEYSTPGVDKHYGLKLVRSNFGDSRQFLYTHDRGLSDKLRYRARNLINFDYLDDSNSAVTFNEVQWSLGTYNSLSVEMGNSHEWVGVMNSGYFGLSLAYRLQMTRNKLSLVSSFTHASSYFPGLLRGARFGAHELRYQVGKYFVGAYENSNIRKPALLNRSEQLFIPQLLMYMEERGVKTGRSWNDKYSLILSGNYQELRQESAGLLRASGYGTSITLTMNPRTYFDASVTGVWRNNALSELRRGTNTAQVYGTVRYRGLGSTFNFSNGPVFFYDYFMYQRGDIYPRLLQLATFGEIATKNKSLQGRFQLSLNQTHVTSTTFTARGEVYWNQPQRGFSLILMGMHNINPAFTTEPQVYLTIRKAVNVPLPLVQKYRNLRAVLYKDLNANDVLDPSDERITKAQVMINGQRLRTNDKGEVALRNAPQTGYQIDLNTVQNLRGWAPRGGTKQEVQLVKDTRLEIPFNKSKYVYGKIAMQKDMYASGSSTVEGIRITAINSKGESTYAITSATGEFFFNLPQDQYIIQIKEDVLGNEYRVAESSQKVDLTQIEEQEVVFQVVQRKRQINIRNK